MAKVKDLLIEMQEHVWYAFDHGMDITETVNYVKSKMGDVNVNYIEEMYQDLMEEF